jgi:hypothetical protein
MYKVTRVKKVEAWKSRQPAMISPLSLDNDDLAIIFLLLSGQNMLQAALLSQVKLKDFMSTWEH